MATTISDIATVSYGYTEKASEVPIGPKFLRITDIQDDNVNWKGVPYCKIASSDKSRYALKHNDIVFARTGATTGKSYLVVDPPDAVCASYLVRLRLTHQDVVPAYVSYFFQTKKYWDAISLGTTGSAQGGFNASKLASLELFLPPLPEQQRIVAILDEAFEGLALATANAEKNLKNVRDLFESYLSSIFSVRDTTWLEQPLGQVATFRNGINYTKLSKGEVVQVVGVKDFQNSFWIPTENLDSAMIDGNLDSQDIMREGDILAVRSNGNKQLIGRTILAGPLEGKTTHSGFTIRIRVSSSGILPDYLCHFMKARDARSQLIETGSGTNISSLNQQGLSRLIIRYPAIVEQKRIVGSIQDFTACTQQLGSIYTRKMSALAELKQSLLAKAFAGELT